MPPRFLDTPAHCGRFSCLMPFMVYHFRHALASGWFRCPLHLFIFICIRCSHLLQSKPESDHRLHEAVLTLRHAVPNLLLERNLRKHNTAFFLSPSSTRNLLFAQIYWDGSSHLRPYIIFKHCLGDVAIGDAIHSEEMTGQTSR